MSRHDAPTRKFLEAALHGDLSQIQAAHAEGIDVDASEGDGMTPLHQAAAMGRTDVVAWLLSQGANVNARRHDVFEDGEVGGDHGATVLMTAVEAFFAKDAALEVIRMLLDAGADVHARDHQERTVLHRGLEYPERIARMIEAGADVDARDASGTTPLMEAVDRGLKESEELLRRAGASEAGLDDLHLIHAAREGLVDDVRRLLAAGARPTYRLRDTALTTAALNGQVEVMKVLLEGGADPNQLESGGPKGDFGPLSRAVYSGHREAVKLLLEAGADPTASNHGIRVLDYAKMGKREGRRTEVPWDEIIALIQSALKKAKKANVALGKPTARSRKVLDGLPVPDGLQFREAKMGKLGPKLLQSGPVTVEDVAQLWQTVWEPARRLGWSCFVVVHGLQDLEPPVDVIASELDALDGTPQDWPRELVEARAAEGADEDDEDDEDYGIEARMRGLESLSESDLEPLRSRREPGFDLGGHKSGSSRHLVLLEGDPGPAPIIYRFGGWNDCPEPVNQARMLRRWHRSHGAELAFLGADTQEVRVDRPLDLQAVRTAGVDACLHGSESESWRDDVRTVSGTTWFFWWD